MDPLADLALRFPEVALVLAHAAIADQGMFASRLAGHPAVLYDTSTLSPADVVELFARVPAERIVFASDAPYGQPDAGLFLTLRAAAYAGLDAGERALVAGGTMRAVLEGGPPPSATAPRLAPDRLVNGRLARVGTYLAMAFGGAMGAGPPLRLPPAMPGVVLARAACRDPDPGAAGPALERVDGLLAAAEQLAAADADSMPAFFLLRAAAVIAATEPLPQP
ncbi:amidohydrolase family protein [Baekduia soli]|uniref:Amidohydrolase family protein n=2 Tax=Baekduia soli TaxID=496014 RepID=A0A5B8U0D2_9ACTN|nr:amidohydrolase family protein [Baekduia soli]